MKGDNTFMQKKTHANFTWESIGDIKNGRGGLGEEMPVLVYRLMQFAMLDALTKAYGFAKANEHFREAGFMAGSEFAKNTLNLDQSFTSFIRELQESLIDLKVGVLRIESFDPETFNFVLTVSQDFDNGGLPITNKNVCVYDEGFIAGVLEVFMGMEYEVREVNCWARGDRVCRFNGYAMLGPADKPSQKEE